MIIVTKCSAFNLKRFPVFMVQGMSDDYNYLAYERSGAEEPTGIGIRGKEKVQKALARIANYASQRACCCDLSDFCD
jgi:hypothetical protein